MTSNADSIKLIVRTANDKHSDFELQLSPHATVHDLKEQIALNHPTKPKPGDQRLIFSGKLLRDTNVLQQVLLKSTSGSSFMIHLVLNADKNASPTKTAPRTTVQSSPTVSPQTSTSDQPAVPSYSSAYEQYLAELNQYQHQLQQFTTNPNAVPPGANYQTQVYLQYCQTHYQMYQNLLAYQRTSVAPSPSVMTAAPTQNSAFTSSVPPAPQPAAAPAPAAAAAPVNNNNEVEQENDLLGVLNMLAELFVLCSIIYFYSTFNRFLVVFVIFTLLYLHCRGYLTLQRRRRAPVPPAPAAADPARANEGDQAREDEADREPAANEAQNPNDLQRPQATVPTPPVPPGDNQITATRLLITAVSTFFSSLIPERPQRA